MPAVINRPSPNGASSTPVRIANYEYDYPMELDLKPGSETHEKLLQNLKRRAHAGWELLSERRSDWRKMDERMRVYHRPDKNPRYSRTASNKAEQARRDNDVQRDIIMPVSYATHETLLTYMTLAFLQDPIFRYEGTGPEDVLGSMMMQALVQRQVEHFGAGLALQTFWSDGFKYGFGAVHAFWHEEAAYRPVRKERATMDDLNALFSVEEVTEREWGVVFEGTKLENIDPYTVIADPAVPIHKVQEAEFFGWVSRTNYMALLGKERNNGSLLFNVKYIRHSRGVSSFHYMREEAPTHTKTGMLGVNEPVDVLWMYVTLIPKEWELSDEEYPETWVFGLAADEVIVAAKPLTLEHGQKPVAIIAPDTTGYDAVPMGRLEIIGDIQTVIDFLYNSHILNLRKAINDMFVVDPYLANMEDLKNPGAGKLIRTRRAQWGRGNLDNVVKQLQVTDYTAGNIGETRYLQDLAQNSVGATDMLQGIIHNRGPRISAQASSQAANSGLSRLEKLAYTIHLQGMVPLSRFYAAHTQQFLDRDTYVKLTGEMAEQLAEAFPSRVTNTPQGARLLVEPGDIQVLYDLVSSSAIVPGSENVQTWFQLFQTLMTTPHPGLIQSFNVPKIFAHIARQMGAKNIDDFINRAQPPVVLPDEEVEQQVDAGNLVALGDGTEGPPPTPTSSGSPA